MATTEELSKANDIPNASSTEKTINPLQEESAVVKNPNRPALQADSLAIEVILPPKQRWNSPRINLWRTIVACAGLLIMGANDAAYGALIPYLETYYDISYTIVSLVFLSPFVGYTTAALAIDQIHVRFGQRGIALLAPGLRVIAYIINCLHPPFPVLVISFVLSGLGNGLEDAAWNAWIGNMENANEVLGILHGAYGLGATLSPLIATAMITKGQLQWYTFYYIMICPAALEWIAASMAFWRADAAQSLAEHPRTTGKEGGRMKETLKNKITWICAVFLLVYVGIEVSIGGWVVSFMGQIRHASPFAAGLSSTGFWLGLTIGRVILGFVTPRLGEKLAIMIYLGLTIGFHLIFYFVPILSISYIAVAMEGFFLGPLFPAAIVAAIRLLPPHLHMSGIGFAAGSSSVGACVLPFAIGAIAQAKGVGVLMPIVLAMLVLDMGIWALLPKLASKRRGDGGVEMEGGESSEVGKVEG